MKAISVLSILPMVMAAACSERPTSIQENPSATTSAAVAVSQGDYVATPAGWYHRSCVHQVPDSSLVDASGLVHRKDGSTFQIPKCLYPSYPSSVGAPGAVGQVAPPTDNGWIEWAWDSVPRQSLWYQSLAADWKVPDNPVGSYSGTQVYYTFPGLESNAYIIQPVIQYGYNGYFGGSFWTMASWHCDGYCTYGTVDTIYATNSMHGTITPTGCSGGKCTWTITAQDLTLGTQASYSVSDTQAYFWATGGAVEVYGLTACNQFPKNGVFYSGIALYDQNGLVTPNWHDTVQAGLSPSCNFRVATTATTDSLFHFPVTPLSVTMSGPSRVKPNVNCGWWANPSGGLPPYSYTWIPNGSQGGDPNEVIESFSSSGTLTVWAYDAANQQASTSKYITVSSSAPNCPYGPVR